ILVDFRSPDAELLNHAAKLFAEEVETVAVDERVTIETVAEHSWDRQAYDKVGVELARNAAEELGLPYQALMTVAGHDSTNMKDVVPTVMLFVPSVDGRSHNVAEYTADED